MASAGTCTIEVPDIPVDLLARLKGRLQERGDTLPGYVRSLIERDLEDAQPHAGMAFAEILGAHPDADWDEKRDDDLEEFIEDEVRAYRAEKRRSQPHGLPAAH